MTTFMAIVWGHTCKVFSSHPTNRAQGSRSLDKLIKQKCDHHITGRNHSFFICYFFICFLQQDTTLHCFFWPFLMWLTPVSPPGIADWQLIDLWEIWKTWLMFDLVGPDLFICLHQSSSCFSCLMLQHVILLLGCRSLFMKYFKTSIL